MLTSCFITYLCRSRIPSLVTMLRALLVVYMVGAFAIYPAQATVLWEDYQGNSSIGTDTPGPNYTNNSATSDINLDLLRTISSNVANATRTGSSTDINFSSTSGTLCDTSVVDTAGTGAACLADAQGRVLYTLVKFPASGTYTFAAAHDDEIDLDLSSDYTNTNYKSVAYNLPVGNAASYTANDTTYENLAGVFSSPTANACILLRIYWNNAGGINHLRLRWTTPSGAVQIVPAAQLFDPSLAASSAGCTGSITGTGVSAVINKIIGGTGRAGSPDQFTVALKNSGGTTTLASATTSGSGTGQQASTGAAIITTSTTYQVTDAMSFGSNFTIGAYAPTIACTRNGTSFTPSGAPPTWTITTTTATNQQIICNITNTRRSATLQLRKTWVNAVINDSVTLPATTGFNANTLALVSTANTANESDNGTPVTVLVGDTGTLAAESYNTGVTADYQSVLGCSGGTLSGTDANAVNNLLVTTATAGTTITCTYTNTNIPKLDVSKTSSTVSDTISASNPKSMPGATMRYCMLVTNLGGAAATTVVANDNLPPNITFIPGSMRSGTTCAAAATVEDENTTGADETDPFGMEVTGTLLTGRAASLATGASFAMIFQATIN
jgi:uncharacterized repeat protein (TIGR01451 family)